jgi:hypothetical protein
MTISTAFHRAIRARRAAVARLNAWKQAACAACPREVHRIS